MKIFNSVTNNYVLYEELEHLFERLECDTFVYFARVEGGERVSLNELIDGNSLFIYTPTDCDNVPRVYSNSDQRIGWANTWSTKTGLIHLVSDCSYTDFCYIENGGAVSVLREKNKTVNILKSIDDAGVFISHMQSGGNI